MYKNYTWKWGVHVPCLPKILLIMRLTTVLLIATMLQVSAAGFAQKVTFSAKKGSLEKLFKEIKMQTGYNVIWNIARIDASRPITVNFKNAPLEVVLKESLKGQSLDYTIERKTIVIKDEEKSILDRIASAFTAIDVKGKVIDENGKPMPGATVKTKNGTRYALTNEYGEFSLKNVEENSILVVSYLGYESKEIAAVKNIGSVQLIETSGKLREVTISTGYQKIDKSQMTGSAARKKGEDLVNNGNATLEQMLQGQLPGVEVVNATGAVGTRQKVRVRGTSTLLGNQEPVWVVDGIIQEDPLPFKAAELNKYDQDPSNNEAMKQFIGSTISWLNPYDIDEITVLKDAASTAIYGVKAANGVIVINTKRGQLGRAPLISYSSSLTTQSGLNYEKLNLMNSKERVDVSREIWERGLLSNFTMDNIGFQGVLREYLEGKLPYETFNAGVKQLEMNNTDWLGLLTRKPINMNHNLSISGGSGTSTYYTSFGYNNQKGQAVQNGKQGYTGSVSVNTKLNSKLSLSARLSGTYAITTSAFAVEPYSYAVNANRVIRAFNEDGSLSYYQKQNIYGPGQYNYNVLNELENSGNRNVSSSLNTSVNLTYLLPAGFRLESIFGGGYNMNHAESYLSELTNKISAMRAYEYGEYGPLDPIYRQSQLPNGGELNQQETRNLNYTWRNSLGYAKVFGDKHVVSGMMGMELRSNGYEGSTSTIYGYVPGRGKTIISPPVTVETNESVPKLAGNPIYSNFFRSALVDQVSNYLSYFVTGSYTYDERYVFTASMRGDASNRFGQDTRSRFKPIWALGGRWNVAREHFFDKTTWFNDFSIRASYGYQGNVAENFGPDLIARIPNGLGAINDLTGEPALELKTLPYVDLRTEKTQTINLGLDFSFFKNRVTSSIDYYNKRSKDLIVMKDASFDNGVENMPMNAGTMTNSGLDFIIGFIPVRNKNVTWSIGMTATRNYNKISTKLLPNPTWNAARSGTYYVEGYPVSSFWVFDFKGLDPLTGVPLFNIPNSDADPNAKFDAVKFMKYAGKLDADFTGGINTSIRFKQFSFSTDLFLSLGGKKLLAPMFLPNMVRNTPSEYNNLSKDFVNRWRQPGDELYTNIPSLPSVNAPLIPIPSGTVSGDVNGGQAASESPYNLYNYSSARLVNASYLRINNIAIRYTLPEKITRRIMSKNLTLGYTLSNAHTFVSKDFKGVDPEVASGSQPLSRTHAFNLSVSF
jgi:TonB-linked SusC/RagA family outer membrane protein